MKIRQLYRTGKIALEIGMLLVPQARVITGLYFLVQACEELNPHARRIIKKNVRKARFIK